MPPAKPVNKLLPYFLARLWTLLLPEPARAEQAPPLVGKAASRYQQRVDGPLPEADVAYGRRP